MHGWTVVISACAVLGFMPHFENTSPQTHQSALLRLLRTEIGPPPLMVQEDAQRLYVQLCWRSSVSKTCLFQCQCVFQTDQEISRTTHSSEKPVPNQRTEPPVKLLPNRPGEQPEVVQQGHVWMIPSLRMASNISPDELSQSWRYVKQLQLVELVNLPKTHLFPTGFGKEA